MSSFWIQCKGKGKSCISFIKKLRGSEQKEKERGREKDARHFRPDKRRSVSTNFFPPRGKKGRDTEGGRKVRRETKSMGGAVQLQRRASVKTLSSVSGKKGKKPSRQKGEEKGKENGRVLKETGVPEPPPDSSRSKILLHREGGMYLRNKGGGKKEESTPGVT